MATVVDTGTTTLEPSTTTMPVPTLTLLLRTTGCCWQAHALWVAFGAGMLGRGVEEQLVLLTGGRDRRGGALLTLGQNPRRERAKPDDYRRLLEYLLSLPWYIFIFLR